MPKATDFPAVGIIKSADENWVVFCPRDTAYEIHLLNAAKCTGPIGVRVEGYIHLAARKIYTVPSGGNFISPIFGPARIVQGRVRYLDESEMVVQAGAPGSVGLPQNQNALHPGRTDPPRPSPGNVVALPGAGVWVAHG